MDWIQETLHTYTRTTQEEQVKDSVIGVLDAGVKAHYQREIIESFIYTNVMLTGMGYMIPTIQRWIQEYYEDLNE